MMLDSFKNGKTYHLTALYFTCSKWISKFSHKSMNTCGTYIAYILERKIYEY